MEKSSNDNASCNREKEQKFLRFGDITDKTRKDIDSNKYRGSDQNKSFEHRK